MLVDYGVILTKPKTEMALRLSKINHDLLTIIKTYQPDAVAIEQIFYSKNTKTVITVAQARGVAMLAAANSELPVAEYTPLEVKQAVVGYGKAEKKQVQMMVQKILSMSELPKPDDAADALAVAICHLHSYRFKALKSL